MTVFHELLLLMVGVWTAAVVLRKVGLPTIIGELLVGVIIGPAVLGWVQPNEIITVLAQLGIFFLMLHAGVETEPGEFFAALRISMGVAIVGAAVPFGVSFALARAFGLPVSSALFVGLTMTATAVVITLKILNELDLNRTRLARVIVASCVIDDMLTLILFSVVLGTLQHGSMNLAEVAVLVGKALLFFGTAVAAGTWLFPLLRPAFRLRQGKGFTFVLILALAFGLLAEGLGLHIILGAYLAGLFFGERMAAPELVQKVEDRLYGIAYSFLGPVFFVSLGFSFTFDAFRGEPLVFALSLLVAVVVGQVLSAGGMARRLHFSWADSLTVGVGMCGRAEMAFVLASLGLTTTLPDGTTPISETVFTSLVLTIFLLNMLTPLGLKLCANRRRRLESAPGP
jgi:Kef-type K+ transport system membrane component KefB